MQNHIYEIVATWVFYIFFVSSGPQIPISGKFKGHWLVIGQSDFAPISKDTTGFALTNTAKIWLGQNHQVVVEFLCEQLRRGSQPRQDYLEFIKLSLIALDEANHIGDNFHFSPPVAYHRARLMAKCIYCLKILLFREQFK